MKLAGTRRRISVLLCALGCHTLTTTTGAGQASLPTQQQRVKRAPIFDLSHQLSLTTHFTPRLLTLTSTKAPVSPTTSFLYSLSYSCLHTSPLSLPHTLSHFQHGQAIRCPLGRRDAGHQLCPSLARRRLPIRWSRLLPIWWWSRLLPRLRTLWLRSRWLLWRWTRLLPWLRLRWSGCLGWRSCWSAQA